MSSRLRGRFSMTGIDKLLSIMVDLRSEQGCPWDKKQTLETLTPYTLEETYELVDAIISGDKLHIEEELGDVLFQVVFYAKIAEEEGWSSFNTIAVKTAEKLLERHPHVFSDEIWSTDKERLMAWEKIKRLQKKQQNPTGEPSVSEAILDDIPKNLPALMKAKKLQKRAASVNFDWPDYSYVIDKIDEELLELKQAIVQKERGHVEEELGDLLFALVNLGRHLKIDPEIALEKCNLKFRKRFSYIEKKLADKGMHPEDSNLDEMDKYWQQAKKLN